MAGPSPTSLNLDIGHKHVINMVFFKKAVEYYSFVCCTANVSLISTTNCLPALQMFTDKTKLKFVSLHYQFIQQKDINVPKLLVTASHTSIWPLE